MMALCSIGILFHFQKTLSFLREILYNIDTKLKFHSSFNILCVKANCCYRDNRGGSYLAEQIRCIIG